MNQAFTLGRSCAKFPVARVSPRDSLSMNSWYVISAASDDDGNSDEKLNAAAVTGEFEWIAFHFAGWLGCPAKKAALCMRYRVSRLVVPITSEKLWARCFC